jgi:hypothetical protein
MRTEVDLTKLSPYQREVLTALVRRRSKNEVVRLLQIVEATAPSAGVFSEATKQAILFRVEAVIEELQRDCEPEPGERLLPSPDTTAPDLGTGTGGFSPLG